MVNKKNFSQNIVKIIKNQEMTIGITSSPSTTIDIVIDITEARKTERALGQMVYVIVNEDGKNVLVIGQIIDVETKNRWHEDPSFKGVIKRHGRLPHLSGTADNRIATISVQACYLLHDNEPKGYILGTSPSTGEMVQKMNNKVMNALMENHKNYITYMGTVYGTQVNLPFWFKHFDKTQGDELGANDAYHIGVFGKTGSGKTVTAAFMLLGYAKNKNNISILVLDPQGQFYLDNECLPGKEKLENKIKEMELNYEKFNILDDICLPGEMFELFGELLANNGFIEQAFRPIYDKNKLERSKEAIVDYLIGRSNKPGFNLNKIKYKELLLKQILIRFNEKKDTDEKNSGFSKYILNIWGTKDTRARLSRRIKTIIDNFDNETEIKNKWKSALEFFSPKKQNGSDKIKVEEIVNKTVNENGNFVILDLRPKEGEVENENLQALFVKIIEEKIVKAGAKFYAKGEKANCLIVMDEAHRFISKESTDLRIKELTDEIIGSVRTTRKYGIGYMFITQTIDSLDDEILSQMRIFAFGYGLTAGKEIRKISETINNPSAIQLYKSFIDPTSNNQYPFMFFGPISPLSFTGSPLFIEMYKDVSQFK
ncbi:MAG: ATP-binding protein [Eubacteriaceae bacterium]